MQNKWRASRATANTSRVQNKMEKAGYNASGEQNTHSNETPCVEDRANKIANRGNIYKMKAPERSREMDESGELK